jgi:hypothetical protein
MSHVCAMWRVEGSAHKADALTGLCDRRANGVQVIRKAQNA